MNTRKRTPIGAIEPIGSYDYPSIAALHACCFDEPWRLDLIRSILSNPGGFGLFGRSRGQAAGFVLCRSSGGEAEVLSLGVAPRLRGQGIARALMAAVIDEAARRGVRSLVLEVAEDNDAARKLYLSLDFMQVGRRADYYKRAVHDNVDALTLRREIKVADSGS